MSGVYAFLAALAFALGTTLQQRGALETSAGASDPRFYIQILRRPAWLLGSFCQLVGGVLHLAALNIGPIVLVEPVLTLSVVLALPLGMWLTAQQVHRREVAGALAVVGGLIVFQALSHTTGGVSVPSAQRWVAGTGLTLCIIVGATWLSKGRRPALISGLLGIAAGAAFGLAAAYEKLFTNQVHHGPVLAQWSTYALVVVGIGGGVFQQAALKTGVLAPAMAGVNVCNLLVSVALGLWVFQEQLAHGNGALLGSAIGLAVTVFGVLILTGVVAVEDESGAAPATEPSAVTV